MRANYVRAFYLPEHQPMTSTYTSHYKSRLPSHINSERFCNCGRAKEMSDSICMVCADARVIVQCAEKENLLPEVVEIMKPVLCSECNERFPDTVTCDVQKLLHTQGRQTNKNASDSRKLHRKSIKVIDLKKRVAK